MKISATLLTRKQLEKLMQEGDKSMKFVQKTTTRNSSELWQHFHQVFINNEK